MFTVKEKTELLHSYRALKFCYVFVLLLYFCYFGVLLRLYLAVALLLALLLLWYSAICTYAISIYILLVFWHYATRFSALDALLSYISCISALLLYGFALLVLWQYCALFFAIWYSVSLWFYGYSLLFYHLNLYSSMAHNVTLCYCSHYQTTMVYSIFPYSWWPNHEVVKNSDDQNASSFSCKIYKKQKAKSKKIK